MCLLFHSAAKIIKDGARFIQCARLKWLWSQLLFVLRGHCVLLHFSIEDMKAPFDVLDISFSFVMPTAQPQAPFSESCEAFH